MIDFLSEEEDAKNDEESEISSIKCITVSVKKGAKTCSDKAWRMSCKDAVSRSSFISMIGTG